MSADLPPMSTLAAWAEQHFTALLQAGSHGDFDAAFDRFIAQDVHEITLNGVKLTRDLYKQHLSREELLARSVQVTCNAVVQAPTLNLKPTAVSSAEQPSQNAGHVGLFYTATFVEAVRVRTAAAEHIANSSLNLTVAPDPSITGGDNRRVFALNQVLVDHPSNAVRRRRTSGLS